MNHLEKYNFLIKLAANMRAAAGVNLPVVSDRSQLAANKPAPQAAAPKQPVAPSVAPSGGMQRKSLDGLKGQDYINAIRYNELYDRKQQLDTRPADSTKTVGNTTTTSRSGVFRNGQLQPQTQAPQAQPARPSVLPGNPTSSRPLPGPAGNKPAPQVPPTTSTSTTTSTPSATLSSPNPSGLRGLGSASCGPGGCDTPLRSKDQTTNRVRPGTGYGIMKDRAPVTHAAPYQGKLPPNMSPHQFTTMQGLYRQAVQANPSKYENVDFGDLGNDRQMELVNAYRQRRSQ